MRSDEFLDPDDYRKLVILIKKHRLNVEKWKAEDARRESDGRRLMNDCDNEISMYQKWITDKENEYSTELDDEWDEEAYINSKKYENSTCWECHKLFDEQKEPIRLIYPKTAVLSGETLLCSEYCVINALQRKLKFHGEYKV
jgi:hypothetical protein